MNKYATASAFGLVFLTLLTSIQLQSRNFEDVPVRLILLYRFFRHMRPGRVNVTQPAFVHERSINNSNIPNTSIGRT